LHARVQLLEPRRERAQVDGLVPQELLVALCGYEDGADDIVFGDPDVRSSHRAIEQATKCVLGDR
jgi:hypothetical protein